MVKQALILTNPGEPGASDYCAGVNLDATNYYDFLQQAQGGTWLPSEVKRMDRPSRGEVLRHRDTLRFYDYVLIVVCPRFAGHFLKRQVLVPRTQPG